MTENEGIRCFCSRRPLLAKLGRDPKMGQYVHVRVFKQARIYGEVVVTEGVVHLRCRECLRWTRITIKHMEADVKKDELLPVRLEIAS